MVNGFADLGALAENQKCRCLANTIHQASPAPLRMRMTKQWQVKAPATSHVELHVALVVAVMAYGWCGA